MSRTVIKAGNLVDVINEKILENHTIVSQQDKIVWIGDNGSFEPESDDHVIDANDRFILPGLIDCHVHLGATTAVESLKEKFRHKDHWFGYIALKHGQDHLKAGFTTLRDCGGDYWGSPLRQIFREGTFSGPRLLVAQRPIMQYGNQESMGPGDWIEFSKDRNEIPSGIDGVTHAVRDRKASGSDFIKTMTTGGVLHGLESQLDRSLWTDEELKAMVAEVNRLGMHLAVHAHGLHGIAKAANAKVHTIEHCSFVDEETAKVMKQNNIYLIPTQTSAFMDKPDLMKQLDKEVQEKTIAVDSAMFANHKIAFDLGVKIALGTDAGVPGNPHGTSAREMTSYVKHVKMTPMQALQTGTIEAAKAIRMDSSIGSLEVGKSADILVVDNNPLENIQVLESSNNIDYVIKDGRILAKSGVLV